MQTKRILITGIVQGVGYRYFVMHRAQALSLCGTVSNCIDGSVEVVAQGNEDDINRLAEQCRQGPMGASVDEVQVTILDNTPRFQSFTVEL